MHIDKQSANKAVPWSASQRLQFIEFRLMWEGRVNRKDLIDAFGISVPQATLDFREYLMRAPENMSYDKRRRFYFPTPSFTPQWISGTADDYLSVLAKLKEGNQGHAHSNMIGNAPPFEILPIIERSIDVNVMQKILECIRERASVEIYYQSLTTQIAGWRRISPHALASDGERWHIRAFCHFKKEFRDFVLGRIMELRDTQLTDITGDTDPEWGEMIIVTLTPNPALAPTQQKIIERDYAMTDGKKEISIRRALLYYLKHRLNIEDGTNKNPANQPVVIANILRYDADRIARQTPPFRAGKDSADGE